MTPVTSKAEARAKKVLRALRVENNYDNDVPRCGTCNHFVHGYRPIIDGMHRNYPPTCRLLGFNVTAHGVCDRWTSRTGDTLLPTRSKDDHAPQ